MDRDELTQGERPEKLDEQVPTSPSASYEKPRVPLNNLKMKFERGEDVMGKVLTDMFTGDAHAQYIWHTVWQTPQQALTST